MPKKLTTEEFVLRANSVHSDIYDYSKVKYKKGKEKVVIRCPVHGDFLQEANSHLQGIGCPSCGLNRQTQARTLSTDDFIRRSRSVHVDIYDYSKAVVSTSRGRVTIVCLKHGDFEQIAMNHLRGMGCPECAVEFRATKRRKPFDLFISQAVKTHGQKYSYEKVIYKDSGSSITISCPDHGDFMQMAEVHLRGAGCPKCGVVKASAAQRFTSEEFIKRSKVKHGNKFDYSLVEYSNSKSRVTIICPSHGPFRQEAGSHLHGRGCKKCADADNGQKRRISFKYFVAEALKVHGDTYDYPDQEYLGGDKKLEIICRKHGVFYQRGESHLLGMRCVKCAKLSSALLRRSDTKSFITRAETVHGKRYNYRDTVYKLALAKVSIICVHHGEFQQAPNKHLQGRGCPSCADEIRVLGDIADKLRSAGRKIEGRLYIVELYSEDEHFFKIGISTQNLRRRLSEVHQLYDIEIIADIEMDIIDAYDIEQGTLKNLSKLRYHPRLYFGGNTECLSKNPLEHDSYLMDVVQRNTAERI
jgi:hypothetical protein